MTQLERDISEANDVEYLIELDKFVDLSIRNENSGVNKKTKTIIYGQTEEEYQKQKNKNIAYSNNIKEQIKEKIKQLWEKEKQQNNIQFRITPKGRLVLNGWEKSGERLSDYFDKIKFLRDEKN